MKPGENICEDFERIQDDTAMRVIKPVAFGEGDRPKRFRRLKCNELVSVGDFTSDAQRGFEPWHGPSGFRADAFVKPIYRPTKAARPNPKG